MMINVTSITNFFGSHYGLVVVTRSHSADSATLPPEPGTAGAALFFLEPVLRGSRAAAARWLFWKRTCEARTAMNCPLSCFMKILSSSSSEIGVAASSAGVSEADSSSE